MAAEIILRVKVDKSQYNAFKKEVNKGLDPSGTNKVKDSLKETGEQAKQATTKIQSLGEMLTKKIAWYSISMAISSVTVAFKEALQEIKAVDTQLTNIKKVSDISAESLQNLADKAYSTASKYGVQASEYMEAVYEYTKAGFQDNADAMAELSTKAMLVGDTTASVADKFLIAGNAAWNYGKNVEALSLLVDKADYINNKYATTFEKIADGFPRVASVASMAGMSAEETMAALGTITATTQETASRASTALRALILNILGDTTTEVEDGVTTTVEEIESLRDALQKYAPDVVAAADATGSLINPMEALKALSEAYKKGDLTQSGLFEIESALGGKLRTNQLDALLKNFDVYEEMLQGMAGAAGTADKEISTMLTSWEAKANILKNTWTEFISKGLSSDVFKKAIDWLTDLLDRFGGLNEIMPLVGGALAALFAPAIVGNIEKMVGNLSNLKNAISTGFRTMNEETGKFTTNWSAIGTAVSIGITAITAAITLYENHLRKISQDSQKATDDAAEQAQAAQTEFDSVLNLYAQYDKAKSAYEQGTGSKEEYTKATETLASALGIEEERVRDVEKAIDSLTEKELKQKLSEMDNAITVAEQNLITQADTNQGRGNSIFDAGKSTAQVNAYGGESGGWMVTVTRSIEERQNGMIEEYKRAQKELEALNMAYGATTIQDVGNAYVASEEADIETYKMAAEAFKTMSKEAMISRSNTLRANIEEASFIGDYLNLLEKRAEYEKAYQDYLDGDINVDELTKKQNDLAVAEQNTADAAEAEAAAQKKVSDAFKEIVGGAASASEAIEKYKKVLEGDTTESDADALVEGAKKAFEAYEKGLKDSSEITAFADLFFSSEQIAKIKAAGGNVADALMENENFRRIFIKGTDENGETVFNDAIEAAKAMGEIAKEFDTDGDKMLTVGDDIVARLYDTSEGTKIVVEDWDALAAQWGMSADSLRILLNMYGLLIPGLEASTTDLLAFADAAGAVTDKANGIKQVDLARVIEEAFAQGATEEQVWDLVAGLEAAQENGDLELVIHDSQVKDATDKTKDLISELDKVGAARYITIDDRALTITEAKAQALADRLDNLSSKNVTVNIERAYASGTDSAPGGKSLVNEEGAELIQANGKAWIAGNGMPTIADIPRGAKVWTAKETAAILGNSNLDLLYGGIKAFASGTDVPSEISGISHKTLWEGANLFADTSDDETLKGLQGIVSLRKAELSYLEATGASVNEQAQKQREIQDAILDEVKRLQQTGGKQEDIVNLATEWYQIQENIDDLYDKQSQEQQEHLEGLEDETDLLKSQLTLIEARGGSVKSQILKQREIRASIQAEINYMKSIGASQEEINKKKAEQYNIDKSIESLEKGLYDNLQNAVQKRMDDINEKREKELSIIDEKIKALQEEHDLQDKNAQLEEKQLAVQKAREALENAKKQRTVRVFNAKTGKWEWTYNASTVQQARETWQSAREDLSSYKAEERYNARIAKLEARQDKINEKYDAQIEKWQAVLDALEEPVKGIQASLNEIERNATKAMLPTIKNINKALKGLGIKGISTAGLYDSGGILKGLGGIKATAEDEMVLPPDVTKKMLSPIGSAAFSQRLGELRYLYGAAGNLAGYANNAIGSQHNGDIYTFGNITLSKEQAKSTTVYELAKMSRGLRSYSSAM